MEHINGAGAEQQCRGVPRMKGNKYITTFTAGVLCSDHENPVLHKPAANNDYSRCKMNLYRGSRKIDESSWQYDCLSDFDERDGSGRFWMPGRKAAGMHQSATWLSTKVDTWCRNRNDPCTLEFVREFKQAGRAKGVYEFYRDCVDFVYDGSRANLQPRMAFKMQNGKGDRVCGQLGAQCKSGGRAPARRPNPPPRRNPPPPPQRNNYHTVPNFQLSSKSNNQPSAAERARIQQRRRQRRRQRRMERRRRQNQG